MSFDVVIVGGGPAGLSAALALGRARKRVLLLDGGPRRNAAATHVHNFLTRDGTPPTEIRRLAREDLARYPSVEVRDLGIERVTGARGAFRIEPHGITARRILLATGVVDELLPLPGFRELWGRSIFQCPYCHGWEIQDRRWGYLVNAGHVAHAVPFSLLLRSWTDRVTLFTDGVPLDADARRMLSHAHLPIEERKLHRLVGTSALEAIELEGGTTVPLDALFVHPPQRQTDLVRALDLALDDEGFVRVDAMRRETSLPGIYAAGDLATRAQAAINAAATGFQAAAAINGDLQLELAGLPRGQ